MMRSTTIKHVVFAGLLATLGATAMAQTPAPADTPPTTGKQHGPRSEGQGHGDPAKMQTKIAKHMADLKAKLKITPEQEPAWTAFTSGMKPTAPYAHPERGEFAKLTTPERLERLRTMRMARNAEMDQRAEIAKTFYSTLNAEQKTTFDAESLRMLQRMGPDGPGGDHKRGSRDKS